MENVLEQLVARLEKALGARLVSVVLYGSAVSGGHHARYSDFNVLCVLDSIGAAELAAAGPIFRWWRAGGSPAPLLLTERELHSSADCFAIEFRDIRLHHRVLHGRDLIAELPEDNSFYRAQVEHDLRAKLLRLRQKACGMLSDARYLRRLLLDSVSTFCVLFRHALILSGVDAPSQKREIVQLARQHFGIEAGPFEKLLDVREERLNPRELDPVSLLPQYLQGISRVIEVVDGLGK